MRILIVIATTLGLFLAACQKPTEVQLTDESSLEIEGITETDTSLDGAPVDTTALLPRDQQNYTGFVTVSSVKSDWGLGVRTTTIARVVVVNKDIRITHNDRRLFFGRSLGSVYVNGGLMIPRGRFIGTLLGGFEYVREIPDHQAGRTYVFTADSLTTPLVVESPQNLNVLSPAGGQRVSRDRDLELRWVGQGNISFIISSVQVANGEVHLSPVLNVRAKRNNGRAVLSRRILSLLPRGVYMFTFVVANRNEQPVQRYQGKVLVQASSIYNVRVDLI